MHYAMLKAKPHRLNGAYLVALKLCRIPDKMMIKNFKGNQ